tara:strand:+ start:21191 stop:21409 length:219 start_codon:yes stop_codon:yes gene_type:complete
MQTTTLMLDLKDHEINALLAICRSDNRGALAQLCESQEQASSLISALDEIAWQLASSGHEGAIETLSQWAVG